MSSPYLDGWAPARIAETGTFDLPGVPGAQLTYGHDEVIEQLPWLTSRKFLGVDIETMGLGKAARYIKCVQVGDENHAVLFDPRDPGQYRALRDVLNCGAALVLHRSAFDTPGLYVNGLLEDKTVLTKIWDTLLYARMAEPDEKVTRTLAACGNRYLGYDVHDTITKRAKNLGVTKSRYFEVADLDAPAYRWDAAADVIVTARLVKVIRQAAYDRQTSGHPFTKMGVSGQEAWDLVERPQRRNRRMLLRSCWGFNWDPEYLDAYQVAGARRRDEIGGSLRELGIRPGNSQDLVKFMDGLNLVPEHYPRTATGLLSGAKGDIKTLEHPVVKKFLELKEAEKVENDYLAKIRDLSDVNGRIHPEFNILGASSTGRDSITGIPVQQFNHAARQIITEDFTGAGVVSVDWTQQEPVLGANMAKDSHVLELYENESLPQKERDMYEIVGSFGHIARKPAKETILAQFYGQGMIALALKLGLITPGEAVAIQNLTRRVHPERAHEPKPETGRDPRLWKPWEAADALGIRGYREALDIKGKVWEVLPRTEQMIKNIKALADKYRCVFTWAGRILPVPSSFYDGEWGVMVHKGPNFVIQGGAADMLDDLIQRAEDRGIADTLMFPMHDEVVVQRDAAPEWAELMKVAPERLREKFRPEAKFRVDLEDLGERWGKPA